jgi:tRNA-splicing ligase RtcB
MQKIDNILSWATDLEENTLEQAQKTSRLPFLAGPLALMPDAHLGFGSTVGSVIPTRGAIIPAAIGVDIGCGMVARRFDLKADQLPDNLDALLSGIERGIPAGVGKGRDKDIPGQGRIPMPKALRENVAFLYMEDRLRQTAANQLGTLGSGNHFVELCLDQEDSVWLVLHSGSRGVGNKLATHHINIAKGLMKDWFINLEDPDLAYLVQGTPQFDAYVADLLWAQNYALANREAMMDQANDALWAALLHEPTILDTIQCHHNYTHLENIGGKENVWITRKGAISARLDQRGIIPGSMGTRSYIVRGLGNRASYFSCSHGAGRRLSRSAARREFSIESLESAMAGKTWNANKAEALLDEHPDSYKDIDVVMAAQADLVEIEYTLSQILNYKGT